MRTWFIAELNENGEIDFTRNLYEFRANNPIRFTRKAIKRYRTALEYGYAITSNVNFREDEIKWYIIRPKKMEVKK